MKKTLGHKILETIHEENITPKPKWSFRFREMLLWCGVVLSGFLASISLGSIIFQIHNQILLPPKIHWWLMVVRIISIIIFIAIAVYQTSKTKNAYRRKTYFYVLGVFFLVAVLGSILLTSRVVGSIDRRTGSIGVVQQGIRHWSQPTLTGLLAGELYEITEQGYLLLEGLDGSVHVIDPRFIDENIEDFISFLRVKMIGYEDQGIYYPCALASWSVRNAGSEYHIDYGKLIHANIQFADSELSEENFNSFFERKEEIMRTNSCL